MTKYIQIALYLIPVPVWAYIDKYNPNDDGGSGAEFVWYIIVVGGIMLINWIINLFKGKK